MGRRLAVPVPPGRAAVCMLFFVGGAVDVVATFWYDSSTVGR